MEKDAGGTNQQLIQEMLSTSALDVAKEFGAGTPIGSTFRVSSSSIEQLVETAPNIIEAITKSINKLRELTNTLADLFSSPDDYLGGGSVIMYNDNGNLKYAYKASGQTEDHGKHEQTPNSGIFELWLKGDGGEHHVYFIAKKN